MRCGRCSPTASDLPESWLSFEPARPSPIQREPDYPTVLRAVKTTPAPVTDDSAPRSSSRDASNIVQLDPKGATRARTARSGDDASSPCARTTPGVRWLGVGFPEGSGRAGSRRGGPRRASRWPAGIKAFGGRRRRDVGPGGRWGGSSGRGQARGSPRGARIGTIYQPGHAKGPTFNLPETLGEYPAASTAALAVSPR